MDHCLLSILSDEALIFYCYDSFEKKHLHCPKVNNVMKAVLASILRRVSTLRLRALK